MSNYYDPRYYKVQTEKHYERQNFKAKRKRYYNPNDPNDQNLILFDGLFKYNNVLIDDSDPAEAVVLIKQKTTRTRDENVEIKPNKVLGNNINSDRDKNNFFITKKFKYLNPNEKDKYGNIKPPKLDKVTLDYKLYNKDAKLKLEKTIEEKLELLARELEDGSIQSRIKKHKPNVVDASAIETQLPDKTVFVAAKEETPKERRERLKNVRIQFADVIVSKKSIYDPTEKTEQVWDDKTKKYKVKHEYQGAEDPEKTDDELFDLYKKDQKIINEEYMIRLKEWEKNPEVKRLGDLTYSDKYIDDDTVKKRLARRDEIRRNFSNKYQEYLKTIWKLDKYDDETDITTTEYFKEPGNPDDLEDNSNKTKSKPKLEQKTDNSNTTKKKTKLEQNPKEEESNYPIIEKPNYQKKIKCKNTSQKATNERLFRRDRPNSELLYKDMEKSIFRSKVYKVLAKLAIDKKRDTHIKSINNIQFNHQNNCYLFALFTCYYAVRFEILKYILLNGMSYFENFNIVRYFLTAMFKVLKLRFEHTPIYENINLIMEDLEIVYPENQIVFIDDINIFEGASFDNEQALYEYFRGKQDDPYLEVQKTMNRFNPYYKSPFEVTLDYYYKETGDQGPTFSNYLEFSALEDFNNESYNTFEEFAKNNIFNFVTPNSDVFLILIFYYEPDINPYIYDFVKNLTDKNLYFNQIDTTYKLTAFTGWTGTVSKSTGYIGGHYKSYLRLDHNKDIYQEYHYGKIRASDLGKSVACKEIFDSYNTISILTLQKVQSISIYDQINYIVKGKNRLVGEWDAIINSMVLDGEGEDSDSRNKFVDYFMDFIGEFNIRYSHSFLSLRVSLKKNVKDSTFVFDLMRNIDNVYFMKEIIEKIDPDVYHKDDDSNKSKLCVRKEIFANYLHIVHNKDKYKNKGINNDFLNTINMFFFDTDFLIEIDH